MKTEPTEIVPTVAVAASELDAITAEILDLHAATGGMVAEAVIAANSALKSAAAIGALLHQAKSLVPRGQFLRFVECRLGWHPRTAQRYMAAHANRAAIEEAEVSQLRLALELVDFRPPAEPALSASRPSGIHAIVSSWGRWLAKHPPEEWGQEDRDLYRQDLQSRLDVARRIGIDLD